MGLPREVLPGRFLLVNRRCLERRFFLRPDAETNQIIWYCLALAAEHAGMDVLLPSFLSNHHHTVAFDREGRQAEFTEYLHRLIARAVNAHLGRWENLWAAEQCCVVHLTDRAAVMKALVYAATNPVKDGLVARVADWPGVNGLAALLDDTPITVRRPDTFFRADGPLPEEATLTLVVPPELGDAAAVRAELRARVAEVEAEAAAARAKDKLPVLGRRAILRQDWNARPGSREPRRGLRPTKAGSRWARIEALFRRREFIDAYRAARDLWLAGLAAVFPAGTYWLRRFANVVVARTN
jgi:hypothetical protein